MAIIQLAIAYLYIDKRLKKLNEIKKTEDWSASQREFYAHCLSISLSVTRALRYYIPERDGRAHIRQNFEKALDEIVEKNAIFDVAARFSLSGLSDDVQSQVSLISVKLSQASSAAQITGRKLKRLSNNLPHLSEVSDSGMIAYTIEASGNSGIFSDKYYRDLYVISTSISELIEHVREAADGLSILVEKHSSNKFLNESKVYFNLRHSNATPESDKLNIKEFSDYLRKIADLIRHPGICFALVDEFEEMPSAASVN
ncbi:hypothetical protein MU516_16170 [Paracoccus sp. YLB-12]|uniref:Uncharacterized protein n=1 Tax=Paracoccus maritimus TaxID=2933292 RepID=A0ABT2KF04_9RHOB|nr:hypothetical protein [Paracoccus sp. YLB-12]MCT4334399.1 hypothetical protein [Paracoccus sp. YLB-12]